MKTVREHVQDMLEMRRIASWRAQRGEYVMARWAAEAARYQERQARLILRAWYA